MITIISKLRVPDYERWARQFEAGGKSREDFGVEVLAYGHDNSDHHVAIVILQVDSEENGKLLLQNPILQKNLKDEGIEQIDITIIVH